jgi:hypothetical protein
VLVAVVVGCWRMVSVLVVVAVVVRLGLLEPGGSGDTVMVVVVDV